MIRIALTFLALLLLPACHTIGASPNPWSAVDAVPAQQEQYRYRSKITGQFVTAAYAKRHPKTTKRELIR